MSTIEEHRSRTFLKSFREVALGHQLPDESYLDALMIHAWLNQLLIQAAADYTERKNPKQRPMQTGQAQRTFLQIFGHIKDEELHRLLQGFYRFTEYDDPLAAILFRALVPLSIEHESHYDFLRNRFADFDDRPVEAVLSMRETIDRWCDWADAVIHLQIHAHWHLSPECFQSDPRQRQLAPAAGIQQCLAPISDSGKPIGRFYLSGADARFRNAPKWPTLATGISSPPQRPWPHPEVDEAIISLWPLVNRHNWTYTDLLRVLRDLLSDTEAYPCQTERNLATYCTHTLRLRKTSPGKTAKEDRPAGYTIALRLCPPAPPPAPPVAVCDPTQQGEPYGTVS
jgi:hypothetical protein